MSNTAKIYCRLSRDEQGQTSIADQEAACRQLATRLGISKVELFIEQPGTSGFKDVARPVFDELMAGLAQGDVVLAWMLDRLTRKGMEQAGAILRVLEERGAHCVTVADGVDTRMDGSDINVGVRAIMGREYVKSMVKNVKRGKASGAAAGKWGGGPRWYGYSPDPDGVWRGPTVVDVAEAKVLGEIRDRYVASERFIAIAADLNARGVQTVGGNAWRPENMLRLLMKKRYVGIRVHNGTEYPASWPAIFTAEQWAELEMTRTNIERMKTWPTSPGGARSYLLTGFLDCQACGGKLRGGKRNHKGKTYRRYRCCGCNSTMRMAEPLELLVTEAVLFRLDTPDLGLLLQISDDEGAGVSEALDQSRTIKQRLDELHADYYSPSDVRLDRATFVTQKTSLEAAYKAAQARLNKELQSRTSVRLEVGQTLRNAWEANDLDWKRRLIGLVIERIIIKPSDTHGRFADMNWRGYRFRPEDIEIVWIA